MAADDEPLDFEVDDHQESLIRKPIRQPSYDSGKQGSIYKSREASPRRHTGRDARGRDDYRDDRRDRRDYADRRDSRDRDRTRRSHDVYLVDSDERKVRRHERFNDNEVSSSRRRDYALDSTRKTREISLPASSSKAESHQEPSKHSKQSIIEEKIILPGPDNTQPRIPHRLEAFQPCISPVASLLSPFDYFNGQDCNCFILCCPSYENLVIAKRHHIWRTSTSAIAKNLIEAAEQQPRTMLFFTLAKSSYFQGVAMLDRNRRFEWIRGRDGLDLVEIPINWIALYAGDLIIDLMAAYFRMDVPFTAFTNTPDLMETLKFVENATSALDWSRSQPLLSTFQTHSQHKQSPSYH